MKQLLSDKKYEFIRKEDKAFICAFDEAIGEIGYESGNVIGNGFCWGKYMIIYAKTGAKSKKVAARIYIRDDQIVLRLFVNQIDRHRNFIEQAPDYIKLPFIGDQGNCNHCKNDHDGMCKFRKTYTIEGRLIEKCNGITFEFHNPDLEKLPGYMALLREFYPIKKGNYTIK